MSAAETYAACINAVNAQRRRVYGQPPGEDLWGGPLAQLFRFDPHRELDANLKIAASYVQAEDVLVDVGGGAGRVGLPLALRCREVINVEPSAAMGEQFEASAEEAGITNARLVKATWEDADGIQGDVAMSADVAYFVQDIVPFIRKLEAAARRRVMITIWSVPPPHADAELFRIVYGEPQAVVPGHRQLLPVLWELGILPDVRVMPRSRWWDTGLPKLRKEALEFALGGRWLRPEDRPRARKQYIAHFGKLFKQTAEGFLPLWRADERELLVTWEPGP